MTKAEDKAAAEASDPPVDSAPAAVVTETAPTNAEEPAAQQVGGPRTVTVKDKDGNTTIVTHAAGVNALVFGQGYTVEGYDTVDAAIAYLAGEG